MASNADRVSPSDNEALISSSPPRESSKRCLVTQSRLSLTVAHVVQRASKHNQLTIYEYCLGLEFLTFHVDSRNNLLYLKSDWHAAFNAGKFILLPDAATLAEVHRYVQSVLAWREDLSSDHVEHFTIKWRLESKTRYRLIPLPSLEAEPLLRMIDNTKGLVYNHPYRNLPELECHIAPPYAVINAGPKCIGLDLDQVALDYHQSEVSDSQMELKRQLELLYDIWALFDNAKEAAKAWEEMEVEGEEETRGDRHGYLFADH